jgi:hypothetical protein
MAEEKKDEKQVAAEARKAARARKVLIFSAMVTGVVFLQASIVLAVCLIPTLVAALVDRQEPRTAWVTVGATNLAAALPAVFSLFETGGSVHDAIQVVTKPSVLIVAYSGAGLGWLIYNNVTPMVAGVVAGRNERRLKEIDKRLKEIVRKWGEDVVG